MGPYLDFAMTVMQDATPTKELEAIRQLPLEKRCVWRVASALKWGFTDVDDLSVSADRQTFCPSAPTLRAIILGDCDLLGGVSFPCRSRGRNRLTQPC
jgi:hypothetical protein